jgi:hypothetical protein
MSSLDYFVSAILQQFETAKCCLSHFHLSSQMSSTIHAPAPNLQGHFGGTAVDGTQLVFSVCSECRNHIPLCVGTVLPLCMRPVWDPKQRALFLLAGHR